MAYNKDKFMKGNDVFTLRHNLNIVVRKLSDMESKITKLAEAVEVILKRMNNSESDGK